MAFQRSRRRYLIMSFNSGDTPPSSSNRPSSGLFLRSSNLGNFGMPKIRSHPGWNSRSNLNSFSQIAQFWRLGFGSSVQPAPSSCDVCRLERGPICAPMSKERQRAEVYWPHDLDPKWSQARGREHYAFQSDRTLAHTPLVVARGTSSTYSGLKF